MQSFIALHHHRHPGASKQLVLQRMLLRIGDSFRYYGELGQYVLDLLKFDVPFLFTIEPDTSVEDKCAVFNFKKEFHTFFRNCEMLSQMKGILVSDHVSLATCNTRRA